MSKNCKERRKLQYRIETKGWGTYVSRIFPLDFRDSIDCAIKFDSLLSAKCICKICYAQYGKYDFKIIIL